MGKLSTTRGRPGLSYLNISERPMSILNIVLSRLNLAIDSCTIKWFKNEVLNGSKSMKLVRDEIENTTMHIMLLLTFLKDALITFPMNKSQKTIR